MRARQARILLCSQPDRAAERAVHVAMLVKRCYGQAQGVAARVRQRTCKLLVAHELQLRGRADIDGHFDALAGYDRVRVNGRGPCRLRTEVQADSHADCRLEGAQPARRSAHDLEEAVGGQVFWGVDREVEALIGVEQDIEVRRYDTHIRSVLDLDEDRPLLSQRHAFLRARVDLERRGRTVLRAYGEPGMQAAKLGLVIEGLLAVDEAVRHRSHAFLHLHLHLHFAVAGARPDLPQEQLVCFVAGAGADLRPDGASRRLNLQLGVVELGGVLVVEAQLQLAPALPERCRHPERQPRLFNPKLDGDLAAGVTGCAAARPAVVRVTHHLELAFAAVIAPHHRVEARRQGHNPLFEIANLELDVVPKHASWRKQIQAEDDGALLALDWVAPSVAHSDGAGQRLQPRSMLQRVAVDADLMRQPAHDNSLGRREQGLTLDRLVPSQRFGNG
mmetsp:Transcript_16661/g.39890  ORF Transcript_16661/g.39890 Transcript_16661/m.39890 type:complete len:447 (+) Transcript_16661:2569-3909(+)